MRPKIFLVIISLFIFGQTYSWDRNIKGENPQSLELIYRAFNNGSLEIGLGYKIIDGEYRFSIGATNAMNGGNMTTLMMGNAKEIYSKLSAITNLIGDTIMDEKESSDWVKVDDFLLVLFDRKNELLYIARDSENVHVLTSPDKIKRISYMKEELMSFCKKHNIPYTN